MKKNRDEHEMYEKVKSVRTAKHKPYNVRVREMNRAMKKAKAILKGE